jgi:PAS domain-containing protein
MRSIGGKLFTIIGIIILIFSSFLLYRTYTLSKSHVDSVVETQAAIALQFDLSIRKYVADKIRPIMYDFVGEQNFIPEAMSTSFVARSIFEDVRTRFPDYVLKFSSDDPRNPANLAGPEELKIIRYFNSHPEVKTWSGNIMIDDREYFAKFNARRMKKSCLHCHGEPEDAPRSLLDRYGAKAGFHRPVGEVIALDTVGIPVQSIQEKLWKEITGNFIFIGLGFILLYLALFVSVKLLVTNRLAGITKHFARVSGADDDVQIEPIAETGHRDEISTLAVSFNTLARKLRRYYNSLEEEIQQREKTEERLRQSNTTLEKVLESSSPICITGTNFEIILANRAYYEIWPEPEKDEGPVKCYQSRHGSLCKTDSCPLHQILEGKEEITVDATKYVNSGEELVFIVTARPYRDPDGKLIGIVENFQDITKRKKLEDEKADLIHELRASLEKVKLLSGFIPICASCKKVRDDRGYWNQVESFIKKHSDAEFSHSICPGCAKEYYDELDNMLDGN